MLTHLKQNINRYLKNETLGHMTRKNNVQ